MKLFSPYQIVSPSITRPPPHKSQRKHFPEIVVQNQNVKKNKNLSALNFYSPDASPQQSDIYKKQSGFLVPRHRQKLVPMFKSHLSNLISDKKSLNEHEPKKKSTISDYAQQLKLSMIRQYQIKKQSLKTKQKRQQEQPLRSKSISDQSSSVDNCETLKVGGTMISRLKNKAMAFKTLNLLYKTIIDNSFQQRKKQSFQLQANRLLILDRFQKNKRTNRGRIIDKYEEKILRERSIPTNTQNCFVVKLLPQDQIIPWDTIEQPFS